MPVRGQDGCSVGASARSNVFPKGRLIPAPPVSGGPRASKVQTHPQWLLPEIHQRQSTPVKIALSQATNDMALTRVGHMPGFKDPLPLRHPCAEGAMLEIAKDFNGELRRIVRVRDLKLSRHTR